MTCDGMQLFRTELQLAKALHRRMRLSCPALAAAVGIAVGAGVLAIAPTASAAAVRHAPGAITTGQSLSAPAAPAAVICRDDRCSSLGTGATGPKRQRGLGGSHPGWAAPYGYRGSGTDVQVS